MGPFLFVTDLHGNLRKYERTLSLASETGRKIPAGRWDFIGFNLVTTFPFRLKDRARLDSGEFTIPEQFGGGILSLPGGWEEIPDWAPYAPGLPPTVAGQQ